MKKVQKIDWKERARMLILSAAILALAALFLLALLSPPPKGHTVQDLTRAECEALNGEWTPASESFLLMGRFGMIETSDPSKCFVEDVS